MKQFRYISEMTKEELEASVVIPCTNEENSPCILIKNLENKTISSSYYTDNLDIKLNATLMQNEQQYYFHIITSKQKDFYSIEQFNVIYEYIFRKILNPITDSELSSLITSLEDYFKITPDAGTRNLQIGVFGELLTIKKLYEFGYTDITKKYHNNFCSKHDVEITERVRMEIKTTNSEKRIHRFKHNQISRNDVDVYISSVLLEPSQEGYSLFDLFHDIFNLYSNNPDSVFNLQKLMKRCNVNSDNKGLKFSYFKAYNEVQFYDAKNLPQIKGDIDLGVTDISYDVDCSINEPIDVYELVNYFNSLEASDENR